jgi:hypothetical protein
MEGQTIQWTKKTTNEPKQSKHYTNTTDRTIQTLLNDNEREKNQTNTHTMEKNNAQINKQKNNNKRKKKKRVERSCDVVLNLANMG